MMCTNQKTINLFEKSSKSKDGFDKPIEIPIEIQKIDERPDTATNMVHFKIGVSNEDKFIVIKAIYTVTT